MTRTLPRVFISESCWCQVQAELERVAPLEGVLVPLLGLRLRDPDRNPCAMVTLEELLEVVITRVVLVPGDRQVNSVARVQVLPHTDDLVNLEVGALVRCFPRLRAAGYIHSHPFAVRRTAPSRGHSCDYEGHMVPLLHRNREANLDTSFSFIACRLRPGAGWRLQAFALGSDARIHDLGFAETVEMDHVALQDVMTPAGHLRPPLRQQLRRWCRELRRRGFACRSDLLFDGWLRLVVRLTPELAVVVLVPIGHAGEGLRRYAVDPIAGHSWSLTSATPGTLAAEEWPRAIQAIKTMQEQRHVAA